LLCAGVALLVLAAATACDGSTARRRGPPAASTTPASPSSAGVAGPCGTGTRPPAAYRHIMWIWMENHMFDQVIGNADAPYETALAGQCGTATDYAAVGSPSLPNYLGATSGDIHGIHDDAPPSSHPLDVDNLFRQVRALGGAEKSYQESMSTNCDLGSTGSYAVKHNPAAYYVGGDDRSACMADDVPLGAPDQGQLRTDLDRDALPTFSFVTPNLCNDTHDCSVDTGDKWLEQWVPVILASNAYRSGAMALFIVWDEPTPMPFIAVSPTIPPGTKVSTRMDHYALLHTTEAMVGISTFLGRAATAPDLRPAFGL
jgi:hypothetical protein